MRTAYDDLINNLARQRQGEVDAARIELTLWTLVKDAQRAEARTRRHPVGVELVVTIDGELLWSQAFAPQLVEPLLESRRGLSRECCSLTAGNRQGPHPH